MAFLKQKSPAQINLVPDNYDSLKDKRKPSENSFRTNELIVRYCLKSVANMH